MSGPDKADLFQQQLHPLLRHRRSDALDGYDAYASAFKTYSTAYDAYKPYEDQLIDALAIYQLYSNQQQAAFDDWRGTIRDAATIQTEITAIDQQMADLEVAEAAAAEAARQQQLAEYQAQQDAKPWYEKLAGYLGGVQDTTLPLAGVTPGTVEDAFNQPEKTPSREMQQLIAMKELLQEELNWSQYYYYADFAGAPDFAEMSQYVPQEEKEQRALDIMLDNYSSDAAPWEDPLYEYINGNEEAGAWLSNAGANYYGPDNAIGAFFGRATENKAESQQMTEQEVATFNYLYATQGKAAAHASISDKHKQLDTEYHEKFEQAKRAWRDYIIEWRAANPGANRSALYDDPKFDELFSAEDAIVDEWTAAADTLSAQAKEAITEDLRAAGYDGVFLENDVGSWGRRTDAIIALDPQQVKNISNKTPTNSPDIRYSVDDGGQDPTQQKPPAAPKKKIRPVAESRPLIAKKDLCNTVLNLFSIPNGQRAEIGSMIDSYADRLIKNGSLTEDDRKAFFDRMYDAGVMVMPAEEYSAFARSHIVDGRIYVSDSVKSDFGDDWADIRRRAFAAGVYLVNDRSASGIDQWNATLSAEDMLPGLFDSEETDERTILERILQVAEEGKDEHLSLAEYTRRLSQQEGISEDEFLDNMERQLDWALRTFAEKARLEVHLRDRTGRKIAQEREKGAERMTRQQAKEAQRRADERQARKDSARRAKERRELRELQQRTLKQLQWLAEIGTGRRRNCRQPGMKSWATSTSMPSAQPTRCAGAISTTPPGKTWPRCTRTP